MPHGLLQVEFNRHLKAEFLGSRITSNAGLLAYRELDDALRLTDLAGAALLNVAVARTPSPDSAGGARFGSRRPPAPMDRG